jgi:hypothetical protein
VGLQENCWIQAGLKALAERCLDHDLGFCGGENRIGGAAKEEGIDVVVPMSMPASTVAEGEDEATTPKIKEAATTVARG